MQSLFPYFGGKSSVAAKVWDALGAPATYLEPFFGSGAVLFSAPPGWEERKEIVCDKDPHICNVWRSIKFKPEKVFEWLDWPVTHADLIARKFHLNARTETLRKCLKDPEWCDPVCAGYWIWAASCWIGSGLICPNQIPHLGRSGMGVHRKSLQGQIPHLGRSGMGVHRKSLRDASGDGLLPRAESVWDLVAWYSRRLRNVKEVTGDWTRICGGNWQANGGTVGIFFDPPYGVKATRYDGIYAEDSLNVADEVRAWCLERGEIKSHRIVLAGYYEEHESILEHGWTVHKWKAGGGYGNLGDGQGKENRSREALFFSPHCLNRVPDLF